MFLDRRRDGAGNVADLIDDGANRGDGVDRALGVGLNRRDFLADVLGGLGGLLGQFLDFVGDDGESLARFPARAASIVAFKASRLVCCAMEVMTLMTWPISALDTPSLEMVALVASAVLTASPETRADSVAFLAMSAMVELISSAPVATVCRLRLTWSVALETTLAWAVVSSELEVICWLTAENSSLALATCCAFSATATIIFTRLPCILFMAAARSPEFVVAVYFDFFACQVA